VRIAIIGAGVSGLTAAHYLDRAHDVTLFESEERLGGHAHTVDVEEGGRSVAVDTGFLVFNPNTYPNFIALLAELGVPSGPSNMSFSVRSDARNFEYSGRDLSALYAQRRHLVSPRFHRMVWDILRFYREAPALLEAGDEVSLADWLEARGYSRAFRDDHLTPMIRAVWSAEAGVAERFPARFLARFFHNHGFLSAKQQAPWLTIPGGSRTYVQAIARGLRGTVRTGAPVERLARTASGVLVRARGGRDEAFDHAVVACHADQALGMLADASDVEREVLGAFPYQPNEAVLHTDQRMMPRDRRVWSSWNAHLDDPAVNGACITYWLNSLQPLPTSTPYFVTLNRTAAIDPAKIIRKFSYAHPLFTVEGVRRQAEHEALVDRRHTSFCGAYLRNGFHEDGVVTALRVCERLGRGAAPSRSAA
jgi:predicted NAD/FAD-binding protein